MKLGHGELDFFEVEFPFLDESFKGKFHNSFGFLENQFQTLPINFSPDAIHSKDE
jgi:hypothetical protein